MYIDYLIGDITMCAIIYIIVKKVPIRFIDYTQKMFCYLIAIPVYYPFENLEWTPLSLHIIECIYRIFVSGAIIWIFITIYAKIQIIVSKKDILDVLLICYNNVNIKAYFTIRSHFIGKLIKIKDLYIKKGFKLQMYELPNNVNISTKHISYVEGRCCIITFMGQLISIIPEKEKNYEKNNRNDMSA